MAVNKAVILAAGKGRRLLPITSTRPKHLIPLAGKVLLQYTIEILKKNGIDDILLIVGYLKEQIQEFFKDGSDFGIKISYKTQKEYLGTANAAGIGKSFVGNSPFMLIYGDLLLDEKSISRSLSVYESEEVDAVICLLRVNDPRKYGVIVLDKMGFVKNIVEKPEDARFGNLVNAGIYIFNQGIFKGIERTKKSPRGEYELTDSMQLLLKDYKIKGIDISEDYWSDIGHPWQLLGANKHILDQIKSDIRGTIEPGVQIHGEVIIGEDTIVKSGTYIEGPVYIGKNSVIGPSAYIRPYSSIENNTKVGNSSEIKNTIIMDDSRLPHFSYAGDSIIGKNVNFGAGTVVGNVRLDKKEIYMRIKETKIPTGRTKFGTVIGDHTQLGINTLIMCGIKIGARSRIGANTVVTEDVPDDTTVYVDQIKVVKK